MRIVRGLGGDDEVHQTAESLRGLSIRDIAENCRKEAALGMRHASANAAGVLLCSDAPILS